MKPTPFRHLLASLLLIGSTIPTALAQNRYVPGDIVENFTLINRATGQPMQLTDFTGHIVFLEWFAHWCPFCVAAAPQVEAGIIEHYRERNGNPHGVPVQHVAINLQSDAAARDRNATTTFIERYHFDPVLQDTTRTLANRFAASGQPIFAIINGLTNSPSARPWELLYSRLGFGSTQTPLNDFRAVIDQVQPPPPQLPQLVLAPNPGPGQLDLQWSTPLPSGTRIESSTNLLLWIPGPTLPEGTLQWSLPIDPDGFQFHRLSAPGAP